MGKILSATVYESRVKVKDVLLGIINNEYCDVQNLVEVGDAVRIKSCSVEEPLHEGGALYITLSGQVNHKSSERLITFELTGDSAVHVVADYLESDPTLEEYVRRVIWELLPNTMGADSKTAQPPTANRLRLKWQKMKPKTRKKYRQAWRLYERMCKEYEREVLDGASHAPKPTIQDFRAKVVETMQWDVGDRTLREVLRMKETRIIK